MKPKHLRALASAIICISTSGVGHAATYTKSDNTSALDLGASWGGTAPGAGDVANWSGTYNTAGAMSALLPGSALTWQGITAGSLAGTAAGTISIGGTGAPVALSALSVGAAGINLTGASHDVVVNAATFNVSGSQTWDIPAGRNLRFGSNVSTANVDGTGGNATVVTVTGGGTVDANQGTANGFADYTGKWIVGSNTMLRGIGTGTAAWGSNTSADAITLNGGTLAVGAISGSISAVTWPSPITLGAATTSRISGQHLGTGTPDVTLQGQIVGDGNLIIDKASGTSLIVRLERNDNSYTGTTSIQQSGASGGIAVYAYTGTAGGNKSPLGTGEIAVTGAASNLAALEFSTNFAVTPSNSSSEIANNISLSNATLRTREGLVTFTGNINLTGANVIQGQVDLKDIAINGLIDGGGSVQFRSVGSQKIELVGANTYTGGTILGSGTSNAGIVVLGDSGSLGTGSVIARGAQIWADLPDLELANSILVGSGSGGGLCFGGTNNISLTGSVTVNDNSSRPFQNSGTGMVTIAGIDVSGGTSSMASFNALGTTKGPFTVTGPITGTGGKVEIRGGTVTLAGACTYTGSTTVSSAGRLNLTGTLTSAITMSGAGASIVGNGTTTGNLTTTGGGGAGSFYLDPSAPTAAITAKDVSINGPTKVELLTQQPLGTTTYTVLNYTGTFTGLANLSSSQTRGTFTNDTLNKRIVFDATTGTRTWTGAATTVWNATDLNWAEGDQKFFTGDAAVFGDTGAGALTIAGMVSPSTATFSNSTGNDYTLTSTAGNQIGGTGSLVKSGTGLVTLVGPNTFSGNTVLSGGTLAIREDACLGSATAAPVADRLTLDGGTLKFDLTSPGNFTLAANRGITLGAGGGTIDTTSVGNSSTGTVAGAITGAGDLILIGNGDTSDTGGGAPGAAALTGTSSDFTGTVTIKSGVVTMNGNFGDIANPVILDGGGLVDQNLYVTFDHPVQIGAAGGVLRSYGTTSTTLTGGLSNASGVAYANVRRTDGGVQVHTGDGSGFTGLFTNARGDTCFDSENWQNMDIVGTDGGVLRFRSGLVTRIHSLSTDHDVHIEEATVLDITSGTFIASPGTTAENFTVQNTGTLTSSSGTLVFDFPTHFEALNQSVSVLIADPDAVTPLKVVKNGPGGIANFSQSNTYTGGTEINGGRIIATNNDAFGFGDVTVNDGGQAYLALSGGYCPNNFFLKGVGPLENAGNLGALRFQNNTVAGTITIDPAGARIVTYGGATGTIAGGLAGSGNVELNSTTTNHNGTFAITGDSAAYTGTLSLVQGRLNYDGPAFGGAIVIRDGTQLAGEGLMTGTLTLGTAGGATLRMSGASAEALTTGGLVLNGTTAVVLESLPAEPGPMTLVNYTTLTGTTSNLTNSPTSLRRLAFTDTGTSIVCNVDTGTRTWAGTVSGTWDSSSLNWAEGDQRFFTGDTVIFSDAAITKNVIVSGSVNPATVTVNNSTGNDYTFTGQIVVPAGGNMVKSGTGDLTLAGTPSNIGGELQINGGRVTFATTDYARTVGAGCTGVVINNGGTLRINAINPLYDGAGGTPITVNAGGVVELNAYHSHFRELALNGGTVLGIRPDGTGSRYADEYSTFDSTVTVGGSQMSTITRQAGTNGYFSLTDAGPFVVADVTTGTDLLVNAPFKGTSLVKNGPGTMVLALGNTYTGTTTVNGGTLLVNNTSGSGTSTGAVTVKTGATFGGTGLVSGAVTVESGGKLAPGVSIESLGTGALTMAAGSTFAAEIDSVAGTADVATVTGNVSLAGNLTITDIAGTPSVIPGGTKLTLLTYTGTLTGVFTGKPEASTVTVGINSFIIRYNDSKAVTLESTAVGGSDYDTWAALYAPLGGPTADDDKDGLTNNTEYAFGLHPKNGASVRTITVPLSKTTGMFTYVRRKPSLTGLTYKVWKSTDLVSWTQDTAATQTPVDSGDNQTVTVTLSGPKPLTAPKTFVRVSAE
ncbi:MAG: autotransporter-associated beta strand repeat-containing protein [Verrucomicrobia bacterium]|nr:autotransporter-associated beta strand repeat-containing protein [Verrucomicrobiota bacterium]